MGVCGSLCQIRAKDQQRQVAGARYLIDLASAHAMPRQIGEAIHDLQQAEQITPEQTRTNRVARDVTRDLLQLSGLRPRPELRELAERFGVLL